MRDVHNSYSRVKIYNPKTFGYEDYIKIWLWDENNNIEDQVYYSFSELEQKSPLLLDHYLKLCDDVGYEYDQSYVFYSYPDSDASRSMLYDFCPISLDTTTYKGTNCVNISGSSYHYPYMDYYDIFYWDNRKFRVPKVLQKVIGRAVSKPYILGHGEGKRHMLPYDELKAYGAKVIWMTYHEEDDPSLKTGDGVDGAELYAVDLPYVFDAEFTKKDDFDYEFKFDYCGDYDRYTLTDMLDETITSFFRDHLGFRGIKYAPGKIIDHQEYLEELNKRIYTLLAPYGYREH